MSTTKKEVISQMDVKRFEKECQKTVSLYENLQSTDKEFGASLLANYRALDNDALRKAEAEKYGIRSNASIDILRAIFDTKIPKRTIFDRLAAARTWEVEPRGNRAVQNDAAVVLGGGVGDAPQEKKKLKERIKTAGQIARVEWDALPKEDRPDKPIIKKSHAKQARLAEKDNVTDVRSWKKQADELALVYGVIHGLESINRNVGKITPKRFVQIAREDPREELAKEAFEKEWQTAYEFLVKVEELL